MDYLKDIQLELTPRTFGTFVDGVECSPRKDLEILIIHPHTHHPDVIADGLREGNIANDQFSLAMIEGTGRLLSTEDAVSVQDLVRTDKVIDPIDHPFSANFFMEFRNSKQMKGLPIEEQAAHFTLGLVKYFSELSDHNTLLEARRKGLSEGDYERLRMQNLGQAFDSMSMEVAPVFAVFEIDYGYQVLPTLGRLKASWGDERYAQEGATAFNAILGLMNDRSARNIARALSKAKGRVLIYAGSAHREAVVQGIKQHMYETQHPTTAQRVLRMFRK